MSLLLLFNGVIPEYPADIDQIAVTTEETRQIVTAQIHSDDTATITAEETESRLDVAISRTDTLDIEPAIDEKTLAVYLTLIDTLLTLTTEAGTKKGSSTDEVRVTLTEGVPRFAKGIPAEDTELISISDVVKSHIAASSSQELISILFSDTSRIPYRELKCHDSVILSPDADGITLDVSYSADDTALLTVAESARYSVTVSKSDVLTLSPDVDGLIIEADLFSLDTIRVSLVEEIFFSKHIRTQDSVRITADSIVRSRDAHVTRSDTYKVRTDRVLRKYALVSKSETFLLFYSDEQIISTILQSSDEITLIPDADTIIVCEPRKRSSDALTLTASEEQVVTGGFGRTDTLTLDSDADEKHLRNVHTICADDSRRIHARAIITYTDPNMDSDLTVTASEDGARNTYILQTADNIIETPYKYAGCAFATLDGTFHPVPAPNKGSVGWWSKTFSDEDGGFANPITITVDFVRDTPMHEIRVCGDRSLNEFPVDFDIEFWVDDGQGGLMLYPEYWNPIEVRNNTDVHWYSFFGYEPEPGQYQGTMGGIDVRRIVLKVYKVNKPYTQLKITEFYSAYREIYEDDDLFQITVLEEIDAETGSLPYGNISANEVTVRLNNSDRRFDPGNVNSPLYGLMKKNRKIEVFFGVEVIPGEIEWYPRGVFWSQNWSAPEGEIWAEVTGLDRLEFLRHTTFNRSTVYENKSIGFVCEEILANGGVREDEYIIHPSLYSVTIPYVWFDSVTHRYALKRLAEAVLGRVYCDVNGKIRIEPYTVPDTPKLRITPDNFFEKDHPMAWTEIVNYVEVHATPYKPAARQVIYSNDSEIDVPYYGTVTKFYIYDMNPCIDIETPTYTGDVSNLDVISWTPYSWGAEIVLRAKTDAPCTLTGCTIYGKPLEKTGGIVVIKKDNQSITTNGLQTLTEPYESPFIQTEEQATTIAQTLLASCKDPRRDIKLAARGDIALYLGDRVSAPEYKNVNYTGYIVIRQEFTWNGGLQCDITGRRVVAQEV